MKEKTPAEFQSMRNEKTVMHVIDVRELHEHESANIGGELIPLNSIIEKADEIPRDIPVILYCRSGVRSATAVMHLEKQFGFENLYNLKGGIRAYAQEIDPTLAPG